MPHAMAQPGESPLLLMPLEAFTHRHLIHDTERQRAVLSRMSDAHVNGRAELDTVVAVLRAGAERHAAGATVLAPELIRLVRSCATAPPRRRPAAQEAINGMARGALLDALASIARSTDDAVRTAAADALCTLLTLTSWPTAPARDTGSLLPSQSMAVALVRREACVSAPAHAVGALDEAESEASVHEACRVLLAMARSSALARRRLISAGVARGVVRLLHAEATYAAGKHSQRPSEGSTPLSSVHSGEQFAAASTAQQLAPAECAMRSGGAGGAKVEGGGGLFALTSIPSLPSSPARDASATRTFQGDDDDDDSDDGGPPPEYEIDLNPVPAVRPRTVAGGPRVASRAPKPPIAPIREPAKSPPERGASGSVRAIGPVLLDLLNMICAAGEATRPADDGGGVLASEAELVAKEGRTAVAAAGGVRALSALLAASLLGGRAAGERKLRCEVLCALSMLASTRTGPRLLREGGALRLLGLILGGPSAGGYSSAARLWAAPLPMIYLPPAAGDSDTFTADPTSGVPMQTQLRMLLAANSGRCIDMFRAWDENGDELISRREFRRACERLGYPREFNHEVEKLYSYFDRDNSDGVDYDELNKVHDLPRSPCPSSIHDLSWPCSSLAISPYTLTPLLTSLPDPS